MITADRERRRWLVRHRFEATLLLAAFAHGWLVWWGSARPAAPTSVSMSALEVDLLPSDPSGPAAPVDPMPPAERPSPTRGARSGLADAEPAPTPDPTDEAAAAGAATSDAASAIPASSSSQAPEAPRKAAVRLFLGPKDLADFTARPAPPTPPPPPAPKPSVGLLAEGLDALDAEKGVSRSSAAISASYRAAQLGPDVGTAVLEVRTDARGAVTTVSVVGNDGAGAWSLVADALLSRLKEQRLRVPSGARGLVARLRIDRGPLAQDLSERGRTKRGVAIGQDHHAKDFGWDESTQAGTARGRMSPSLGVSSEDLRRSVKTRVRLLSQHAL